MHSLIPWGVGFFDAQYGGMPRGRAALLTGCKGSGKTSAVLQFTLQGLTNGENAIVVTTGTAEDFRNRAARLDPHVDAAIARGQLGILSMADAGEHGDKLTIERLVAIVRATGAARVAVDNVLPWVCPPPADGFEEFLMGIAPRIEKGGATTLLTLPRPASPAARVLRRTLQTSLPLSVTLTVEGHNGRRFWEVGKFEGVALGSTIEYAVDPDIGLVRVAARQGRPEPESQDQTSAGPGLARVLLPPRQVPLSGLGESIG